MNKRILIYNREQDGNAHLSKNIEIFSSLGISCVPFQFFPKSLLFGRVSFLYLNWYENLGSRNTIVAFGRYLLKLSILYLAKIRGVKIITSNHNKTVHNGRYFRLCQSLMTQIYKRSDRIVIFTKEGANELSNIIPYDKALKKAFFVPPVNYVDTFPLVRHKWLDELGDLPGMKVVMFGGMKDTYKNVEMVIDVANTFKGENILFVLAGKTGGPTQTKKYQDRIQDGTPIHTEFRFIQNDEMAHLLSIADVTIAPYELSSVSNSGVTRLSFSYGKTIVCSNIPSVSEIPDDLIYKYEYKSLDEQASAFGHALRKAYNDYLESPENLKNKGIALRNIMIRDNSPEVVKSRYEILFASL